MKMIKILALIALLGCTQAWWSMGHMVGMSLRDLRLVYDIARQHLNATGKEDVLKKYNESLIYMTEKDAFSDLYAITCWMDNVKAEGGAPWSGMFHYVDKPFFDGIPPKEVHPQANATGALVQASAERIEGGYTNSQLPQVSLLSGLQAGQVVDAQDPCPLGWRHTSASACGQSLQQSPT